MSETREPSPERAMKMEPTPDLVVSREQPAADPRFPKIVQERVLEMKQKDEILRMWKAEQTTTYIPCTAQGRQMKMQARLRSKLSAREKLARNPFIDFEKRIEVNELDSRLRAVVLE
jgi:hypothetical protein